LLFSRFLRNSISPELWKFYLAYVRRTNPSMTDPQTREVVKKAFEFALLHIGHDRAAGDIWREYIDFVKAGEAKTTWEEQQKMDALRRLYHRAVVIPLDNVEQLWRELDQFENGLNKITVRCVISFLSTCVLQLVTMTMTSTMFMILNRQKNSWLIYPRHI
jgi:cleavage stimulation factor subunit 3